MLEVVPGCLWDSPTSDSFKNQRPQQEWPGVAKQLNSRSHCGIAHLGSLGPQEDMAEQVRDRPLPGAPRGGPWGWRCHPSVPPSPIAAWTAVLPCLPTDSGNHWGPRDCDTQSCFAAKREDTIITDETSSTTREQAILFTKSTISQARNPLS